MGWLLFIVALMTVVSIIVMLAAADAMLAATRRLPARVFDGGMALFGLSLVIWLVIALAAFFGSVDVPVAKGRATDAVRFHAS